MSSKQLRAALLAALGMGISTVHGAYLIEIDTDGLDDGSIAYSPDFAFDGGTTTAFQSAKSNAIGMTGGDSIFGGDGSPDTYVYTYTPDSQADNLIFAGGEALGNGDFATGAAGGGAGTYAVYATWNATSNVSGGLTNYRIDTDGASVSTAIDQNDPGGLGSGVDFGNVWVKIGEIEYTSGDITVIQTPTSSTYVSMRAAGVLFELMADGPNDDYEGPPGAVIFGEGDQQFFGIAFERDKAMALTHQHTVQRSTDLENWGTTDLKLHSVTDLDLDTELVTFRSMTPMVTQSREFLRLETRVKMPPNAPYYVAMTFDDGPHPTRTPELLDHLAARNIPATFYVVGKNVNWYPQIIRRMINEGHEIGNHSMNHPYLTGLTDPEVIAEVGGCHDAVIAAATIPPATIRPTYGAVNDHLRALFMTEWGYPTVLWNIDPRDWDVKVTDQEVIDTIIDGVADWFGATPAPTYGPIILSHDIHQRTVDLMPGILDTLISQGYSFVTVSEVLEMRGE